MLIEEINTILYEWNPIDVPNIVRNNEYIEYVNEIVENGKTIESIEKCLISIISKRIGLSYDSNNKEQKKEISEVACKIEKAIVNYSAVCMFCGTSLIMNDLNSVKISIEYSNNEGNQGAYAHIKCLKSKVHEKFAVLEFYE